MGPHWRRTPSMGRGWTCTKCGICRSRQRTRCVCVCVCVHVCAYVCVWAPSLVSFVHAHSLSCWPPRSLCLYSLLSLSSVADWVRTITPLRALTNPIVRHIHERKALGLRPVLSKRLPCADRKCVRTPHKHTHELRPTPNLPDADSPPHTRPNKYASQLNHPYTFSKTGTGLPICVRQQSPCADGDMQRVRGVGRGACSQGEGAVQLGGERDPVREMLRYLGAHSVSWCVCVLPMVFMVLSLTSFLSFLSLLRVLFGLLTPARTYAQTQTQRHTDTHKHQRAHAQTHTETAANTDTNIPTLTHAPSCTDTLTHACMRTGVDNLLVLCGDGRAISEKCIAPGSVQVCVCVCE